jgi:cytochrome c oxidase cbb3-type subunit IV
METVMDINFIRTAVTVLTFASFIGICWWAWRRRTQEEFDVAAQLPFADTSVDTQRSPGTGTDE